MNPNTLYVQNPNYNPLDAQSNRYVTDAQAAQQASQKAAGLNDIFTPFNQMNIGKIKTYTADNFYTPLAPQVPAGVTQVQQPLPRSAAPVAAQATRAAVANLNVIPERVAFSPTGAAPVAAQTATSTAQPAALQSATQDITALAQQAGQAGMSLDAYMGLLEKGNTPTLSQNDAIRTKLGIPNLVDEAFKKPDTTQIDRYRSLYSDAGLGSVKEKIAELDASIAKKRQDLNAATGELNNNPWISQGTRQGRLKNLQELAFADINNDIDSKNAYLQQYNDGVGQIEKMLSLDSADQQANRQLTVDKLNYLLNEAERQAGGIQQENITAGLRSVPEFLKGVLNRESTAAQREIDKVLATKTGTRVGGGIVGAGGRAINTGALSARAQAVLEAPELLSNYTPTERGKIVDELVAAGADVTSIAAPKLAAAQREQISQYDDLVRQADMAGTILSDLKLDTGVVASRVQATKAIFGGAKDFTEYRSVVDNMGSTLLKMRSGAAVTPQEFERLRGFIPQINDDEATAATKIQAFYTELDTARQNYILRQTQTTNQIKKGTGQSTNTVSDQEVDTFLQSKGY